MQPDDLDRLPPGVLPDNLDPDDLPPDLDPDDPLPPVPDPAAAAFAAGRAAALRAAAEVADLCALAGLPHMALAFIEGGFGLPAVRRGLLNARAEAHEALGEIVCAPPHPDAPRAQPLDPAAVYAARARQAAEARR